MAFLQRKSSVIVFQKNAAFLKNLAAGLFSSFHDLTDGIIVRFEVFKGGRIIFILIFLVFDNRTSFMKKRIDISLILHGNSSKKITSPTKNGKNIESDSTGQTKCFLHFI